MSSISKPREGGVPGTDVVDPFFINIITKEHKEYWILFGIAVAGKSAKQTSKKIQALLSDIQDSEFKGVNISPFEAIEHVLILDKLEHYLHKHKTGKYTLLLKAYSQVVLTIDVDTMTVDSLEKIHGIGPKTARMIMLYIDKDFDGVPLDTHVLKFLAKEYPSLHVPKSTPPAGKKYTYYEDLFKSAAASRGVSIRQLDTEVWNSYAKT